MDEDSSIKGVKGQVLGKKRKRSYNDDPTENIKIKQNTSNADIDQDSDISSSNSVEQEDDPGDCVYRVAACINENKKAAFDAEKEKVLSYAGADVRRDFYQIGFVKWKKNLLPVLQLGPYDVSIESGIRDQWIKMAKTAKKFKTPLLRLIYWYGVPFGDNPYTFVLRKSIIPYEDGLEQNMHKLPARVQEKKDKNEKLTKLEEQLDRGLKEIEMDVKIKPEERWERNFYEPYELEPNENERTTENEDIDQDSDISSSNSVEQEDDPGDCVYKVASCINENKKAVFDAEKEKVLSYADADVRRDFYQIGFARLDDVFMPVLQIGPYDVSVESGIRDEWIQMATTTRIAKTDMLRLINWYGVPVGDDPSYSFLSKKSIISYEFGLKRNMHKLPKEVQKKKDKNEKLTKLEEQLDRALEEIEMDAKMKPEERWIRDFNEAHELEHKENKQTAENEDIDQDSDISSSNSVEQEDDPGGSEDDAYRAAAMIDKKKKAAFDAEKEKVLSYADADVRRDFHQIGFVKWDTLFLPVLQIGPYDISVESGIRDEWIQMAKTRRKAKIPLSRLVYWYGTPVGDDPSYSFLPKNSIISYEDGLKNNMHKLPAKIQKKKDKNRKLTKLEEQLDQGLEEIEIDVKIKPEDRWVRDFYELYEMEPNNKISNDEHEFIDEEEASP